MAITLEDLSVGDRAEWDDRIEEDVEATCGSGPFTIEKTEAIDGKQVVTIRDETTGTLTADIPTIWLKKLP